MNHKRIYKLLKKYRSNSGFTLTELLVGLVMSGIVIGALGFGLMQVLSVTQSETSKSAARNEISRAMEFISDELRRAQTIEVDTSLANIATVASNFDPLHETDGSTDIAPVLALQIPGVSERVIYSVAPPQSGQLWRGPLVIYRWGPALNSDGSYSTTGLESTTSPGGWKNLALIDGVDDTTQSLDCDGDGTNETYQGFYACVVDDDGDGIVEDGATDTNGDGVVNADDSNDDVDGFAITAQLYFTGGVETVSGLTNNNYAAQTRTVARARTGPSNNSYDFTDYIWSFKDLGGDYSCTATGTVWDMRTDFGNDSTNPDDTIPWIRDPSRQPQPIDIDSSKPLTITSSPIGQTNCNSRGNDYRWDSTNNQDEVDGSGNPIPTDGTEVISQYDVKVSHTIDFDDPTTFNGDENGGSYNTPSVKADNTVQFLKRGSVVPSYGGFDVNNDGDLNDPEDQPSLGKFLYEKGYAVPQDGDTSSTNIDNPDTVFVITNDSSVLGDDQRIIAFEVGHNDPKLPDGTTDNPGFDLQDNIFVVTSDVFKKKFDSNCFSGSCP